MIPATDLFNGSVAHAPALTQLAQILQSMRPNRQGAEQGNPSQEPYLTAPALAFPTQQNNNPSNLGSALLSNPQTWTMFGGGGNSLGLSNGTGFSGADLSNIGADFAAGANPVSQSTLMSQAPSFLASIGSFLGF